MAHYQRLGIIEIEPVISAILRRLENPGLLPSRMEAFGASVSLGGLRLRTFAESPLCCSDPKCTLVPTHFAVERSNGPERDSPQTRPYHLNLYGINEFGDEVLFTHDHTLARGLGGEDARHNTTMMCSPCNRKKSVIESQIANRRRKLAQAATGQDPQPPSEKKLARQQKMFDQEQHRSGLRRDEFIAFCHEQAMAYRKQPLDHDEAISRRKMATALGMSVEGYIYLRHIHNVRMIEAQADAVKLGEETRRPARMRA